MASLPDGRKEAVCNTCTLNLVSIAYRRAPMFRVVREPLKLGMRFLCWAHRVNPAEYEVRTPACYGCVRFYKIVLKDKSALFCRLNNLINPAFDAILERIVTAEELQRAKAYARSATAGEVTPQTASDWMKGQRTGF